MVYYSAELTTKYAKLKKKVKDKCVYKIGHWGLKNIQIALKREVYSVN